MISTLIAKQIVSLALKRNVFFIPKVRTLSRMRIAKTMEQATNMATTLTRAKLASSTGPSAPLEVDDDTFVLLVLDVMLGVRPILERLLIGKILRTTGGCSRPWRRETERTVGQRLRSLFGFGCRRPGEMTSTVVSRTQKVGLLLRSLLIIINYRATWFSRTCGFSPPSGTSFHRGHTISGPVVARWKGV